MQPIATVVIPAYNAEKDLEGLIDALKKQTIGQELFETIIIDDGSTDHTADIAEKLGFRVIRQKNQGPAAARNHGIRHAGGKIVVFTDSDCLPESNWLEEIIKPFEDYQIAGVQGSYRTIQTKTISRLIQLEIEERYKIMRSRPSIDFIGTYSAAYRKTDLVEIGFFDERFPIPSGEDTDLSYRMSLAGKKMVFVENAVVYHRHPESVRKYFKMKFGRGYWRVRLYRKNPTKTVKDDFTPQYLKLQFAIMALCFAQICLLPLSPFFFAASIVACLVGVGLTSMPSMLFVSRIDRNMTGWIPFFHIIRASALFLGFAKGLIDPKSYKEPKLRSLN